MGGEGVFKSLSLMTVPTFIEYFTVCRVLYLAVSNCISMHS